MYWFHALIYYFFVFSVPYERGKGGGGGKYSFVCPLTLRFEICEIPCRGCSFLRVIVKYLKVGCDDWQVAPESISSIPGIVAGKIYLSGDRFQTLITGILMLRR